MLEANCATSSKRDPSPRLSTFTFGATSALVAATPRGAAGEKGGATVSSPSSSGIDVNAMEPVGTHAEIEASLNSLGGAGLITSAEESEATLRPVAVAAPGVGGVNSASPTPDPATHAKLTQLIPKLAIKRKPPKW